MQNPIKCYNVESFGSIHRVYADQSVDTEYIQETLNIGKVSVFQFSYLGVGRPGLCALMIVVQNLVCMSSDTFEHIFKRIQELRHIDVRNCFAPMFPVRALKSIEMMLESIMGEDRNTYRDNIIKNKAIKATFDAFFNTLYSQENIKKASRAAYDAMSDEQRERYTLLADGACVLKEYVNAKNKENSKSAC